MRNHDLNLFCESVLLWYIVPFPLQQSFRASRVTRREWQKDIWFANRMGSRHIIDLVKLNEFYYQHNFHHLMFFLESYNYCLIRDHPTCIHTGVEIASPLSVQGMRQGVFTV